MKKATKKCVSLLISLLILLGSLTLTAVYAKTPEDADITASFVDPNFLAAVRGVIGKPDGPVFASDVADIERLMITRMDISDLSGIEFFVSLEELHVQGNQLTQLDMTKSPALAYLGLSDNRLTELNISKNSALKILKCDWNELTELDVSNNPALEVLGVFWNRLTELDVSNNNSLEYLYCDYNYFKSEASVAGLETIKDRLVFFSFDPQRLAEDDDIIFFAEAQTAGDIREKLETEDIKLLDKDGEEYNDESLVGTGSVISLGGGEDEYTVVVTGDTDGDGEITAADARLCLRASSRLTVLDGKAPFMAANVLEDEELSAASARKILRVSSRLDKF